MFNKLYVNNDYTKCINLIYLDNKVIINSSYDWKQDEGIINLDNNTIKFNFNGECTINDDGLYFSDKRWLIDSRKNLLFIGANDMAEINNFVKNYKNGLFIEPIPSEYNKMTNNLEKVNNKYNTNFIGSNNLITSENDKEYEFNVFDNHGASSSIYEPIDDKYIYDIWKVKVINKILLKSKTIEYVLEDKNWNYSIYDAIIDVQGAELEVLKGFNKETLKKIKKLTVEISKKEFYKGGVLFDELNSFLINNNFKLNSKKLREHGDAEYLQT
jgi:FkbM family methyltransferase